MKAKTILVISAMLVASACLAQDAVKIEWKPKAGMTSKLKLATTFKSDFGQGVQDVKFSATITNKVIEVKPSGDTVLEEKTSDVSLMLGEQDMSAMVPSETATLTLKPNGKVVEKKSDQPDEMKNARLDNVNEFVYPDKALKVNETWVNKFSADKDKGTRAALATYTYLGMEKVGTADCYKVKYVYKETEGDAPMSAEGTMWLRVDGAGAQKADYTIKNVTFGPSQPTEAKVNLSRID